MEGLLARLNSVAAGSQKVAKRLVAYRMLLTDPVNNAFAREKALAGVSGLVNQFPDSELREVLAEWVAAEQAAIERDKEEFRFGFGTQLAQALEQAGLKVRGQLPVLRAGMFSLRVDFAAGKAVIFWGPEVERLKESVRLVPAELASTLIRWSRSLKEKSMEPERLARLMTEGLRRVYVQRGLEPGSRVPLLEVLAEVVLLMQPKGFRADPSREKFVEYPRVRFSYDLFRLKASGQLGQASAGIRVHVATFDKTTDKTSALWVPDNEEGEGTYYSYISLAVRANEVTEGDTPVSG
ncbi:MAG: hypothetical protein ABIL25_03810 [candidate division WOR-3 bacterium]